MRQGGRLEFFIAWTRMDPRLLTSDSRLLTPVSCLLLGFTVLEVGKIVLREFGSHASQAFLQVR
jgi:hypothetical protein